MVLLSFGWLQKLKKMLFPPVQRPSPTAGASGRRVSGLNLEESGKRDLPGTRQRGAEGLSGKPECFAFTHEPG